MERIRTIVEVIKRHVCVEAKTAIVLGSGLGQFANELTVESIINYNTLPNFPVTNIPGHKGRFVIGYLDSVPLIVMQGRIHYYQGYSMEDVTLPIRVLREMGIENLILTNAAGGVDTAMQPGDVMAITDHINFTGTNPCIGDNFDAQGERFFDLCNVYTPEFIDIFAQEVIAYNQNHMDSLRMHKGVYMQFSGPSYETPAEVRMAALLGASAVGMSTACEAIVAKHCGMKVLGISSITNLAAGISPVPLTHDEVQATANLLMPKLTEVLKKTILRIDSRA